MTAPSRRAQEVATSNTDLTSTSLTVALGDLIVVMAGGGDTNPQPQLLFSNCKGEDSAGSSVTFGDGTSGTVAYDKRKDDSGGSGGYLHIWSTRIVEVSASPTVTMNTVSNWSTGTRRWAVLVLDPGSGNSWPARASRTQRTSTTTDTAAAAADPWTIAWTGSHYNAESAGVLAVYHANAKTISVDWDNSGDYTSSNSAGDTGDGGSTVFFGGTGSGTNQGVCFGDAFWDTGGIPGGTDTLIGIDGSSATGAKGGAAVLYKISAPTTITGTASFAGGGTFAATGTRTSVGNTATFAGGGSFTAVGTPTVNGTLHFDGGGIFTAIQQGITVVDGTASFSGGGSFSATGTVKVFGVATFDGGGSFTAIGAGAAQPYGSGNSWSSSSAELVGGASKTGTASFAGGGTFTATGHILTVHTGLAHFAGGGSFTATGTPTVHATASFDGGGTFTATSSRDVDWTFVLVGSHWHTALHNKWHTTLVAP